MRLVYVVVMLLILASPVFADSNISGNAVSGREVRAHLIGTLAPKGSLEFRAAPLYTHLADYRDKITDDFMSGKMTRENGYAAQHNADVVRAYLDDALRACGQDNHTGQCTKDSAAADKLLKEAAAKLKKLR